MSEQKVKVDIFGNTYNIQGEAAPEYIYKLAEYVDTKMNEVDSILKTGNVLHTAILAALNIADEYFQLRDIDDRFGDSIVTKTNALISMLEEGIIGDVFSSNLPRNTDLKSNSSK